jgi:hypothetical protein
MYVCLCIYEYSLYLSKHFKRVYKLEARMAMVVTQKGLNPYAPVFIPMLTTSSPDHHSYPPTPQTFFCYYTPYLRTFYTNFCFPTTHPSLFLAPPQKDLVSVIEPTISFAAEPTLQAHAAPANDPGVEKKVVAKRTSPKRYRNLSYGGRGGTWWEKCGEGENFCRKSVESLKKFASKVEPLNKFARGRFRAEAKKKNYSSVLPVEYGVRKTTIMIRNIPSKYTYICPRSSLSLSLSLSILDSSLLHVGAFWFCENPAVNIWAWHFLKPCSFFLPLFQYSLVYQLRDVDR